MTDDGWQMRDEGWVMDGEFGGRYVGLLLAYIVHPPSFIVYSSVSWRSLMRNRLIEVEGEARDHGPGGEFGEVGAVGVRPLADA